MKTSDFGRLLITRKSDKSVYSSEDDIVYTVEIENISDEKIYDIIIFENITEDLKFVVGSVKFNKELKDKHNPVFGVILGDLNSFEKKVIEYKAKLKNITYRDEFITYTNISYSRYDNNTKNFIHEQMYSRGHKIVIKRVDVEFKRYLSKDMANLGDIINYSYEISNIGTLNLENVLIRDQNVRGLNFIENSVYINDMNLDYKTIEDGLAIGIIRPDETVFVSYDMKVVFCDGSDLTPFKLSLISNLEYGYKEGRSVKSKKAIKQSNAAELVISSPNFNDLLIDGREYLPIEKPDIDEILNTIAHCDTISKRIVDTNISTSIDGRVSTGKKVMIQGLITLKLEYTSKKYGGQSVHLVSFEKLFNAYVVLPNIYNDYINLEIAYTIDDINVQIIDPRSIFKNINVRLEALIIS